MLPIALIGGALLLLLLVKPGAGLNTAPQPPPTRNVGTGTPQFTQSGAGNTVRTVGSVVGGIADIVSQITGRGVIPNVASMFSPNQATAGNLTQFNNNSFIPDPSTSYISSSTSDPINVDSYQLGSTVDVGYDQGI